MNGMDCLYLRDGRSQFILGQSERYDTVRIVPYDPQTGFMVRGGGVITARELTALIRDFVESKKEVCPEGVISDCHYNRDGKCHMALRGDGNPHTECESMIDRDMMMGNDGDE